jgi:hypothetical protein
MTTVSFFQEVVRIQFYCLSSGVSLKKFLFGQAQVIEEIVE